MENSDITQTWARFGIEHLSASAINSFISSPARFVVSKVLSERTPAGAAALRGIAVEAGLMALASVPDLSVDQAVEEAIQQLNVQMLSAGILGSTPSAAKEIDRAASCIRAGAAAFRALGQPLLNDDGRQHKITLDLGVGVPIIGYLDALYPSLICDIKSVSRLPSDISASHGRQFAIYAAATGLPVRAFYVSERGVAQFQAVGTEVYLASCRDTAVRIARFLGHFENREELLAACPPPDLSSYQWNSEQDRALALRVFGTFA